MKSLLKFLFLVLFTVSFCNANAQKTIAKKQLPDSFSISKQDFDKLFSYKVNAVVKNNSNSHLNKAVVLLNTKYGSNKQLKLKLKSIDKSYLVVQINGDDSTLLFIISDDKSVFYKSRQSANKFEMIKCTEDEIVSE